MKLNKNNKLLLAGFCLSLYTSYIFSISNTIESYNDYKVKSEIIKNNLSSDLNIDLLQKEKRLDSVLLNTKNIESNTFQTELLKLLNKYCSKHELKIDNFQEVHIKVDNKKTLESYPFTICGSFNDCILALNDLENENGIGIIKHLEFVKIKNYKQNSEELKVNIILQKS